MARSMRVLCEHCDQPFRTARDRLGETAICPSCSEKTVLRDPSAPVEKAEKAPAEVQVEPSSDADLLEQHAETAKNELFGDGSPDPSGGESDQPAAGDSSKLTQKPGSAELEADLDAAVAEAGAVFSSDDDDEAAEGSEADIDFVKRDAKKAEREYNQQRTKVIRHRRQGDLVKSNYLLLKISDEFEHRFGGLARKARQNPALSLVALGGVIIVLIIGFNLLFALVFTGNDGPQAAAIVIEQDYYYDLNTGELFTAAASQTPPISAPSGPYKQPGVPEETFAGARAYVYTCTQCDDSNYIGYVEVYSPTSKEALDQFNAGNAMSIDAFEKPAEGGEPASNTPLFADLDNLVWVPANSEKGLAIVNKAAEFCGEGVTPTRCIPEPVER